MKMKTAKENKLFNKIIDFYLLNCPVVLNKNKVCVRAKSFAELGLQPKTVQTLESDE